jgi:hypothetical protein
VKPAWQLMDAEVYIWIVRPSKGVEPIQNVCIVVVKGAYRRGDRKGERGVSPKFWLVTAMGVPRHAERRCERARDNLEKERKMAAAGQETSERGRGLRGRRRGSRRGRGR